MRKQEYRLHNDEMRVSSLWNKLLIAMINTVIVLYNKLMEPQEYFY